MMEALTLYPTGLGGTGDIPLVSNESLFDVFGGEVIEGYCSRLVVWTQKEGIIQMVKRNLLPTALIAEVFEPQGLSISQNDPLLYHILQLSHIAGPGVIE